jgi:hypothetical protein
VARRLQDENAPATHPTLLSFVAGAAWPLVLVALAEAGAMVLTAEVMHDDGPRLSLVTRFIWWPDGAKPSRSLSTAGRSKS